MGNKDACSSSFVTRSRSAKRSRPPQDYESLTELLSEDEGDCDLKKIVLKHEDWLKGTKVKDVHCDIVTVSCAEFSEERAKRTPLLSLIKKQLQKSRDMFIIRPHSHCQTPTYKRFDIQVMDEIESVDSVSYMDYKKLSYLDKKFIFRRNLVLNPEKYTSARIYDATNSYNRSIQNLKQMNPTKPLYDVTLETTLFDYDFIHNWQALSRPAVQVENCGFALDLTEPEAHYLDVTRPITPMLAMPFRMGWDFPGISSSYRYYSFPGSTTPMHVEDLNAAALNQNLGPGNKPWLSSTFKDSKKMWDLLRKYNNMYKDRQDNCIAHFRKKADFILATQLKDWNVDFKIAIQKPGDIVVTPTGVPHQVTSIDYAVNETLNIIDDLWFKGVTNELPLCPSRSKCKNAHGHDYNSLTGRLVYSPHILFSEWTNYHHLYVRDSAYMPGTFDYGECLDCYPRPQVCTKPSNGTDTGSDLKIKVNVGQVAEVGVGTLAQCLPLQPMQSSMTRPVPWDVKLFSLPHVSIESFHCPICNTKFANKNTFNFHMHFNHTTKRPHICEECGKKYKGSGGLRHHRRMKHKLALTNTRQVLRGRKQTNGNQT